MDGKNWKEVLAEYAGNEEILQLYEDWGGSDELKEVFEVLDAYSPAWNKEKELGSWAAEFILDMLEQVEEELGEAAPEQRKGRYEEIVDERYEDFRNGHQFARINNVAIHAAAEGPEEDIRRCAAEEGEKNGFPVLY